MPKKISGPVVVIAKFSTLEEVVAKANNSHYGLSSTVFTESLTKVQGAQIGQEAPSWHGVREPPPPMQASLSSFISKRYESTYCVSAFTRAANIGAGSEVYDILQATSDWVGRGRILLYLRSILFVKHAFWW